MILNYILIILFMILLTSLIVTGNFFDLWKQSYHYYEMLKIPTSAVLKRNNIGITLPEVKKDDRIPKIIYQTQKNINFFPKDYLQNLKNLNPKWDYKFFEDEDCKKFIREEFGILFLEKFNSFKLWCHKIDLWRLCILYKYGGVYIDSDILLLKSLDFFIKDTDFFIPKTKNILIGKVYNAIIASSPGNLKIKSCILDIMKINQEDLEKDYCLILRIMYSNLKNYKYPATEKLLSKYKLTSYDYYITDNMNNILAKSKIN